MGTYPLQHIIREWGKGNMTEQQVIGQMLLLLQELREQIQHLESWLLRLEGKR